MITKITSVDELKQIFLEIFLNKTDKVSDVSDESVLNGIAYGCGKLAQRTLANQAIIEGHIFPDTAAGGCDPVPAGVYGDTVQPGGEA